MLRKVCVPGLAALLAAVLAGCTHTSGSPDSPADSKAGDSPTTATAAQPGKYRTLPNPCHDIPHDTLDALLPGMTAIQDEPQRARAYEGTATVTYDDDRRVGCRWKIAGSTATHRLFVDFERVVSYDSAVSDDLRAQEVFAGKESAAGLADRSPGGLAPHAGKSGGKESSGTPEPPAGGSAPEGLEPRVLDDLGDAAFLDDRYTTTSSSGRHRTVTVVFRTSNVIATIEYDEQPAHVADIPDSKEMQDRARKLAAALKDRLRG